MFRTHHDSRLRLAVWLVAWLAAMLMTHRSAEANNTFFLPGDSFFFLRLGPAEMTRLHPKSEWKWGYSLPREGGFFCGYAGFSSIQLTVPVEMRRSLGRAIKELESEMKPDKDGKLRAGIFVYNPDFSIHDFRIGVQYNENWAAETEKFGHSSAHARLEDFVQTTDALMQGWRDAPRVPALKVKLPELPDRFRGAVSSPVVMEDFQLVVIPNRDYAAVYERRKGARMVQVTKTGLQRFVAENGRWVAKRTFRKPLKDRDLPPPAIRGQRR